MDRARLVPGLVLIVLGVAFLLAQYFDFGPALFLVLLGVAFLIPYAFTRAYGLLIPGCILAGIGMGLAFERTLLTAAASVPIGLGLGFVAIYVIQLLVVRASHWWPLIPGGILVLVGVAAGVPQAQLLLEKGWPLILIGIGLAILAAPFLGSRRAK